MSENENELEEGQAPEPFEPPVPPPAAKRKPGRKPGNQRRAARAPARSAAQMAQGAQNVDLGSLTGVLGAIADAERQARDRKTAEQSIKVITDAMGRLSDEGFRILTGSDEFQQMFEHVQRTAGTKPGDPVFDANGRHIGYVPFSYADFERIYPMHTWVPRRTDTIEVNGVACRVYEGFQCTAPKIFFDIQEESLRAEAAMRNVQRDALENAPSRMADGTNFELGGWHKMTTEELLAMPGNREV